MNSHIQQLQPVPEAPFRNQMIGLGRQFCAAYEATQPPEPAGFEAQDRDMAVGRQHPVHLAQDGVRPVRIIQHVRQQHAVDRVGLDRQVVELADGGDAIRHKILINQIVTLCPGILQEGLGPAPKAQLQALLAENAVESFLDDPALPREQRLAQAACQPLAGSVRKM